MMFAGESSRWPRPAVWLALGALFVAAAAFFLWRLGGDLSAFPYRPGSQVSDLTVTFWPNIHFIKETWRLHGQIPLWRTLIFCGSPFDADPQSGLWYPPNLVFALVRPVVGFNLLFLTHTIWGGLGMAAWARATGTSEWAALLSAVAYAFTPRTLAHLGFGHVGLVYAAAWVPWALWAANRVGSGRWTYAAALGASLGMQIIAHPQLAFYTGLVSGAYGAALALRTAEAVHQPLSPSQGGFAAFAARLRTVARQLGPLLLSALLGLGVSAVQLLPLLRLAPLTARSTMDFQTTAVSSLPPRYLWGLILGYHRGFADYVLYPGLPILALALLALRRRRAWGWWVFIILALLYATGTWTPLYRWAYRLLPGASWLRAPSRIWFLCAAALALMAAWGLDDLLTGWSGRARRWLSRVALGLGALAPALVAGYAMAIGHPPGSLVALGVVTPLSAALIIAAAARRLPRGTLAAAMTLLVLADLWVVDATLVDGRSSQAVFADDGLAAFLEAQRQDQPFRVYSPSYSPPRHIAAQYGLETADGVDPLYLEAYATWMEAASSVQDPTYRVTVPSLAGGDTIATANRDAQPNARMLGLLNVRYVAAEFPLEVPGLIPGQRFGSTHVYENEHVLPEAFVVGEAETVPDFDAALTWVQTHDVARSAAVEGGPGLASGDVAAEVEWDTRSPNRLALTVRLDRPGLLVLSQTWYPSWQARVDGEPATLWRVDGVLSGVYLDPGDHEVSFIYRPRWTAVGGLVSLVAVAFAAVVSLCGSRGENHPYT